MSLRGDENKEVLLANIQSYLDEHTNNVKVKDSDGGFGFVRADNGFPLVRVETWDDAMILLNGIKIGAYSKK